MVKVVIHKR